MRIECITPVEEQEYLALVDVEKDKVRPEAEAVRASRIQAEAPRLAEQQNITVDEAAEVIRSRSTGKLQPDDVIRFQSLGNVAVSSILTDSVKYDNLSCADPLEPEEGTCKAKFFANTDSGTPLIHSMLHGGIKYYLQNNSGITASLKLTTDEVIYGIQQFLSDGSLSTEQWCGLLMEGELKYLEVSKVIDFLSAELSFPSAVLLKEFLDYQARTETGEGFDKLIKEAGYKFLIGYKEHNLNETIALTEKAMMAVSGQWPYFLYGNVLSYSTYEKPTWLSGGADDAEPPEIPVIKPYSRNSLYLRAEQSVQFYKRKPMKNCEEVTATTIPMQPRVVSSLLDHPEPLAPIVTGLVTHPIITNDGRLIEQEGIDEKTRLLVQYGGQKFDTVPDNIGREDAHQASVRIFSTLFDEFCFRKNDEQESLYQICALALLLTGIFRKAIFEYAPGFLIVANVQGSGKTTLARIIHTILTGKDMPVSSLGAGSEEMKKELLATLMQSPAMVCYDNILDGSEVNDPILAKVITSPSYKGRILGKTQEATVPTNTVITMTGNNVTLSADLVRRFITIALTAEIERPETRVYKYANVVQHCLNNRKEIVRDCLIITKAYFNDGCPVPPELSKSSGFNQWDRMVRFPLFWTTGIDVIGSMEENRKHSTENVALVQVINVLSEFFSENLFTASQVMDFVEGNSPADIDIINSVKEGFTNLSSKSLKSIRSLTWVLKKMEGRLIDNMTLRRESSRNRADKFYIKKNKNGGPV